MKQAVWVLLALFSLCALAWAAYFSSECAPGTRELSIGGIRLAGCQSKAP